MRTCLINPVCTAMLLGLVFLSALAHPTPAAADGEFAQFDYAPNASSLTGTIRRDRVTATIGWSDFDEGHATTLWGNYGVPLVPGAWLRLGPSLRIDDSEDVDLGAKIGVERFSMNEQATLFLLGEFNTTAREYLALAQVGHRATGIAAEVSLQGNNDGFREESLALSYQLRDIPVRLRLGYRFDAEEVFVGFSVNTF